MKLRSASALLLAAATLLFALLSRSLASKEARPRPSSSLDAALDYISLEKNKQRFVKDLLDLVSIPSISSLPERKPDVERAAVWCSERLEKAGLENVQIIRAASKTGGDDGGEPPSPPAVYGDWLHAGANKAIVLIYGHFDVQPADAETEPWTSPPFEPVVRGGAVWGRGAQVRSFLFSLFSFSLPLLSPFQPHDLHLLLLLLLLLLLHLLFLGNRTTREASWAPSKPSRPSSREEMEMPPLPCFPSTSSSSLRARKRSAPQTSTPSFRSTLSCSRPTARSLPTARSPRPRSAG